ncbi:copper amine oxidase [Paenibacillus sp. Soil766]|uniref:glycoside hydrolase family 26 protein n=1 Tax=Paenibacillus sp. Soil766 TaxID=1736404 RepID=UPI00070F2454|nr:glycosyl hydrolase [Paenibacillus sp. Soil766]KRF03684.1 copper amine oxidase [Paenibacillus sp. Soil766]
MRNKVVWALTALLGLASCITLPLLIMKTDGDSQEHNSLDAVARLDHPPAAVPPSRAKQPDIVTYWVNQEKKSEQEGHTETAAAYRNRIDVYTTGLPAAPQFTPNWPIIPTPSTNMELYLRVPVSAQLKPTESAIPIASTLAKHEPASGVYIGMLGADRRVGYDVTKIEDVYGRKHALYLSYVGWRKVQTDTNTYFPARTAERVKGLDGALQIGWEPRFGLNDVQDDEYVRRFAREAKASGIPIFLRYASEMNGAWVPWHGEPQLYIEKFRLIHDIMAEEAPNVAMVWSPNFWPPDTIDSYYPGDAYVDWVGFSLYSTPFSAEKEQLKGTVIDTFAPLYKRYSHKPIMISEGAVAHTYLPTNQAYWSWAESQLGYMYGLLPRLFPQVKAITYFNFSRAQAIRTNGSYVYDIGENPFMDGYYQRLIASDWFLSKVEPGVDPVPYSYSPVLDRSLPTGQQTVLVYPKLTNEQGKPPFAVAIYQGSQFLGVSYEAPWEIDLQVPAESASEPWYVVAYNDKMEVTAVNSVVDPLTRANSVTP